MVHPRIKECVKLLAQKENLENYEFHVEGESSKGDGYLGDITFVTIRELTNNKNGKTLHIVIKAAATNNILREKVPIKECYVQEIHNYEVIIPALDYLQKEKSIQNLLNYIPQYYLSQKKELNELIILKNLKTENFDTWDRKIPMTFSHIQLVLKAYGQWHALSLALKQEKPAVFEKLTANSINMMTRFTTQLNVLNFFFDTFEDVKNKVIKKNCDISRKLQFTKKDFEFAFIDSFFEDLEDSVILHGDCWNNNFLFKSNVTTNEPSEVKIIDWQCTSVGSPAIDLSHFIYACVDTKTLKNVEDLLKIYYDSLETTLESLGLNASKLFSYQKLVKHWNKFSKFGFFVGFFVLKFSLCESDETIDFVKIVENGADFDKEFRFKIKNDANYLKRARNNLFHYVHNLTELH